MTPEQQRIVIAEACGWKGISPEYLTGYAPWRPTPYSERVMGDLESIPLDPLPDYPNDLNAMHEAEKTLKQSPMWDLYCNTLAMLCGGTRENDGGLFVIHQEAIHATAAQRAEAFLHNLNR